MHVFSANSLCNIDNQCCLMIGPNSIAKYNIERESTGRYKVTYIPVECGIYRITVKWNGREVDGIKLFTIYNRIHLHKAHKEHCYTLCINSLKSCRMKDNIYCIPY